MTLPLARYRIPETALLLLALGALGAGAIHLEWLWRWNQSVYDSQLQWTARAAPAAPEDVLIVGIDERSLLELGRWPWPRSRHGELLERLARSNARAVAIDILFLEPDLSSPDGDRRLANAMSDIPVTLPVVLERLGQRGQLIERLPFPALAERASLGHVHVELDRDGIGRSVFLRAGLGDPRWETLAGALLRSSGERVPARPDSGRRGIVERPNTWVRREHMLVPFLGPPGTFATVSYADVLSGAVPREQLEGRLVLVGLTASGLGDDIPTPVSGHGRFMPGVEFNANVLQALRTGRLVQPLSETWRIVLTILLSTVPVLAYRRVRPRNALLVALAMLVLVSGLSGWLLFVHQAWFPPVEALVLIVLGYPLWSWRRLESAMRYLGGELERIAADRATTPSAVAPTIPQAVAFLSTLLPQANWATSAITRRDREHPLGRWRGEQNRWRARLRDLNESMWVSLDARTAKEVPLATVLMEELAAAYSPVRERDITDVAALEARIAELESANAEVRKLRAMVDGSLSAMADGFVVVDLSGQVILANRTASQYLLGDPGEDLVGRPVLECLGHIGGVDWKRALAGALAEAQPTQVEVGMQGQQVPGRELLVQLSRLGALEVPALVVINLSDIRVLKDNERRRAELVSFLSHDLRSPIVSMLALVELSASQQEPEELRALFARARGYAERSLEMVEQFLGLTRAESPDGIKFREVDLVQLAMNAFEQVWAQAKAREVRLTQRIELDEAWMEGDSDLLQRVMVNLLDNAIKFTPAGREVGIGLQQTGEFWQICVYDHGDGIPAEGLDAVFDRFARGGRRPDITGVGLGLAFVKAVVERHGGRVQVESQIAPGAGQGTKFLVSLPGKTLSVIDTSAVDV